MLLREPQSQCSRESGSKTMQKPSCNEDPCPPGNDHQSITEQFRKSSGCVILLTCDCINFGRDREKITEFIATSKSGPESFDFTDEGTISRHPVDVQQSPLDNGFKTSHFFLILPAPSSATRAQRHLQRRIYSSKNIAGVTATVTTTATTQRQLHVGNQIAGVSTTAVITDGSHSNLRLHLQLHLQLQQQLHHQLRLQPQLQRPQPVLTAALSGQHLQQRLRPAL